MNPYDNLVEQFSPEQLKCLVLVLLKEQRQEALNKLLDELKLETIKQNDCLLFVYIQKQANEGKYKDAIQMISTYEILDIKYCIELQTIWNECHYNLYQMKNGIFPKEVQRFRIRLKNPFPMTIWDGIPTKYAIPIPARKILESFFANNRNPDRTEKEDLAQKTKLCMSQVNTWFKNKRNRQKPKDEIEEEIVEECIVPSTIGGDEQSIVSAPIESGVEHEFRRSKRKRKSN